MSAFIRSWLITTVLVGCNWSQTLPPLAGVPINSESIQFEKIRPILDSRCVACHSCMEAPCQLNMQSYEGVLRGAFKENVYNGLRIQAVPPTRLFEDAFSTEEWRSRGFHDVLSQNDESIFISAIRLSNLKNHWTDTPTRESMICPSEPKKVAAAGRELAMPHALPPLSGEDQQLLSAWVRGGAKGRKTALGIQSLPASEQKQIREWEEFLNGSDLKSQLVSRYLFEHLFMAHFYFKESPRKFMKLVRSSKSCKEAILPIASRRPTDSPGMKTWHYCFYEDPATVVYKTHIPYELSGEKLKWLRKNFFEKTWKVQTLPSFSPQIASNPLKTYSDIPVLARYRFLLENAHYQVMTFIKGPVCNGSFAVNSIQEQFYVFFVDPEKDLMVRDLRFAQTAGQETLLPGSFGENPEVKKLGKDYFEILKNRTAYRRNLNKQLKATYPQGLDLDYVWNGNWEKKSSNDNAVLTVFRNDDNAKVMKGAIGDTPKTVFLLDYSTFERLVYNLAANFDVYDNVAHQLLSRLYMDILRMDAEDNFLQLLPSAARMATKDRWYRGASAQLKLHLMNEEAFASIPSKVQLQETGDVKTQVLQNILFARLKPAVRPLDDRINWKNIRDTKTQDATEKLLREIASVTTGKKGFSTLFPEFSVLMIEKTGGKNSIYSILHNREHENVSWILRENARLAPEEDTLTILPGVVGAYPNQFFRVREQALPEFITKIRAMDNESQYLKLVSQYGVSRTDEDIWKSYDEINRSLLETQPIEGGFLDLSRYSSRLKLAE